MRPPVEILDHEELARPAGGERAACHGDLILAIVSEYNRRKSAEARCKNMPGTADEAGLPNSAAPLNPDDLQGNISPR